MVRWWVPARWTAPPPWSPSRPQRCHAPEWSGSQPVVDVRSRFRLFCRHGRTAGHRKCTEGGRHLRCGSAGCVAAAASGTLAAAGASPPWIAGETERLRLAWRVERPTSKLEAQAAAASGAFGGAQRAAATVSARLSMIAGLRGCVDILQPPTASRAPHAAPAAAPPLCRRRRAGTSFPILLGSIACRSQQEQTTSRFATVIGPAESRRSVESGSQPACATDYHKQGQMNCKTSARATEAGQRMGPPRGAGALAVGTTLKPSASRPSSAATLRAVRPLQGGHESWAQWQSITAPRRTQQRCGGGGWLPESGIGCCRRTCASFVACASSPATMPHV